MKLLKHHRMHRNYGVRLLSLFLTASLIRGACVPSEKPQGQTATQIYTAHTVAKTNKLQKTEDIVFLFRLRHKSSIK